MVNDVVDPFVDLLSDDNLEYSYTAACVLLELARMPAMKQSLVDVGAICPLLDCGAVPVVVELLESADLGVVLPAICAVCEASQDSTGNIEALIEAGVLPCLSKLLESSHSVLLQNALKTIINITSSGETQVGQKNISCDPLKCI